MVHYLMKKKIYFLENTTDKILSLVQELEEKIEKQKIYLFAEILDKKVKSEIILRSRKN